MHQAIQQIQQIRSTLQQLAQGERQNAQMLSQQPGNQFVAQHETWASQQLQQCIQLCNQVEQSLTASSYNTTAMGSSFQATGVSGIQQVMQADRQANQWQANQQHYTTQGSYGTSAGYGYGSGSLNQVMQADHQASQFGQPSQRNYNASRLYTSTSNANAGYAAPGLGQVMQADHQSSQYAQPSQRNYNNQWSTNTNTGYNAGALNQVMQADRQAAGFNRTTSFM